MQESIKRAFNIFVATVFKDVLVFRATSVIKQPFARAQLKSGAGMLDDVTHNQTIKVHSQRGKVLLRMS